MTIKKLKIALVAMIFVGSQNVIAAQHEVEVDEAPGFWKQFLSCLKSSGKQVLIELVDEGIEAVDHVTDQWQENKPHSWDEFKTVTLGSLQDVKERLIDQEFINAKLHKVITTHLEDVDNGQRLLDSVLTILQSTDIPLPEELNAQIDRYRDTVASHKDLHEHANEAEEAEVRHLAMAKENARKGDAALRNLSLHVKKVKKSGRR